MIFANPDFEASSNYGIGKDGSIGQYVPEAYRSWCTSSYDNDNRAITIEVASDIDAPYKVTDAAYKALIKLLVDICRRNGKKKLLWFGDKDQSLSYSPKPDELVMTVHRWFANKSCPGDYLYNLHGTIFCRISLCGYGCGYGCGCRSCLFVIREERDRFSVRGRSCGKRVHNQRKASHGSTDPLECLWLQRQGW